MAVVTEYYSDRDPDTRFADKKEADAHDRLMELCEENWEAISRAAGKAGVELTEDQAWDMARALLTDEDFRNAVAGKKPKAKSPAMPDAEGKATPPRKAKAAA